MRTSHSEARWKGKYCARSRRLVEIGACQGIQERVIEHAYVNTQYDYSFVIAIRVDGSKAELSTPTPIRSKSRELGENSSALEPTRPNFYCRGVHGSLLSAEQLGELAAYAVLQG